MRLRQEGKGGSPAATGRLWLAAMALAAAFGLAGCGSGEGQPDAGPGAKGGPPPAMPVTVAAAIERSISDADEFVGRIEPVERVELRPRVSGYLLRVAYTQGADVAQGAVLFEIDAEPFRVELQRAEAELARARNRLELARNERMRTDSLVESGAVSRQEADERRSAQNDADAALRAAEAAVAGARLNLGYTRVQAPINGRSGRAEVTAGNFVTAGQTVLTTIVRIDPIYVTFEADEQVYLRFAALAGGARGAGARRISSPVEVGLADEQGYPAKGRVEFVDNRVNPQTGTIYARTILDNRDGRFTPGLFARVRLTGGTRYSAVLIDERAIGTDQNRRFVLVIGPDGQAQYRQVMLGPLAEGLRVVRDGLKAGETIVVDGLQRVRPGMPVQPNVVAMDPKQRTQPPSGPAK